jgi:hypothetical protein
MFGQEVEVRGRGVLELIVVVGWIVIFALILSLIISNG